MQRPIIDVAAERIAAALIESDDVDGINFFQTLTSIAEPVAATLRAIEQTRRAKVVDTAAAASSGHS